MPADMPHGKGSSRASAGKSLRPPDPSSEQPACPSTGRSLAGRLLELRDQEHRSISRELHDTAEQNLGALSIGLSMILRTPGLDPSVSESLEESITLANSCVSQIRTMSYLLHPPLLDELGLVSALRAYSTSYSERTGIQLDLDLPSHLPRLPQATEIALFRIAQEGLANIHLHSGSKTAILRLKHDAGGIELELVDHGSGLPSEPSDGLGIASMCERALQLGGHLTIVSDETGTTLTFVKS